jgi:hypothetical protein
MQCCKDPGSKGGRTLSLSDVPRGKGLFRLLRDVACLLVAVFALWLLHVYGRTLPTAALSAVWVALALVIGGGLFWRSRLRRRALLAVYLAPESGLHGWLRGGWVMAARQLVIASLLALVLVVALVRTVHAETWIALVITVPLLILMQAAMRNVLAGHVSRLYLPEVCWRLAVGVAGAALLAAVVTMGLHREYPNFAGVSLERAVWHLVDRELARSEALLALLQMAAAKDGLRLWLAQQLLPHAGTVLLQLAAWVLVLAAEAVFVWSYLLFCNGVVIGVNIVERRSR